MMVLDRTLTKLMLEGLSVTIQTSKDYKLDMIRTAIPFLRVHIQHYPALLKMKQFLITCTFV